ncbi:hypothetical protein [Saccharopolyspora sp. ASAGF58]|uniref:hypothetical protein n=1 Tax=Saccharopolyspora sp. ASAGF58 TaxID=2719023 RepID=UPI00143FD276|nr:hypothetical protein [Saccharopolyspora sp. ASAGF58]QIZ35253.1 hypothetical protein FDZ84_11730 [Saccharopolyspora sp. ASAGF58]
MDVLLGFMNSPMSASTAIGALAAAAAFVAVFPLRGGNGQHAGAGPGVVSVWQIRDTVQCAPSRQSEAVSRDVFDTMAEEACQAYLAERCRRKLGAEPPPYVGKHRLAIEDLVDEFHPKVTITLGPTAFHQP